MVKDFPAKPAVKVIAYITTWCPDCMRSRRVLQRSGIPFEEIDTERVAGSEEEMRAINGGSGKVPTIIIDGPCGRCILIEPSDADLNAALRAAREDS